jgi:hypothetical protein
MNMDALTVAAGFLSFGIFLSAHVITFRFVGPERLLKALLVNVLATLGLPLVLMVFFYFAKAAVFSWQAWICAAVFSELIQGLLCFFYVLCIFGPYETSVRMRLVREIGLAGPQGLSLQKLLERYNTATIVKVRLSRLVGSGDVVEKGGLYFRGRRNNFFFAFDAIAGVFKKWMRRDISA